MQQREVDPDCCIKRRNKSIMQGESNETSPQRGKKTPRFWERYGVIIDADLSQQQKWLLAVLYRYCGDRDDGKCWVSQSHLAESCGWKGRNLRKVLGTLEETGVIRVTRRGKTLSNIYQIEWNKLEVTGTTVPLTKESDRHHSTGVTGTTVPSDRHSSADLNNKPINNPKNKPNSSPKGKTKKWNPRLSNAEFKSLNRGASRFDAALKAGEFIEGDRIRFLTLWRYCGRCHSEGKVDRPGGLFVSLIRAEKWEGSQADEDEAHEYIKNKSKTVEGIPELTEATNAITVSDDEMKGYDDG